MESFIYQYANWIAAAYLFLFVIVAAIGIYLFVKERKEIRIKVLRKGINQLTWYLVSCPHCKSELMYSSKHIRKSDKPVNDFDDLDDSEYIICPVCGKRVGVFYKLEVCKH